MKKLINVSNHPSSAWTAEQREGWDKIVDVPFPNVPPEWDVSQVFELATQLAEKVGELSSDLPEGESPCVFLAGDFSLCFVLYTSMLGVWRFYFPTTERVVEEKDGRKTSVFKFIKWREF